MSTLASNAGMNWQDSVKAEFGNSGDLKIYHESNVNYIYGGSTNFPIAFMTNATERLRIKGDGETNIGTGATTIAKFCMTGASNGGHQIVGQASNNVAALDVYSQHGSDANKLSFAVSDNRTGSKSNSFVVRGDGRIGIGLTNPTSPLDITGGSDNTIIQIRSTDAGAYMTAIDNTGAGSFGQQGAATVITCDSAASVADSAIVFQIDANNEKMRLDNSGRLLIGTTTEGHTGADDLTIATSGETGITIRSADDSIGNIYFSDATSGTAEYVGYIQYYHTNNSIILGTNNANALTIDSSQNATFAGTVSAQTVTVNGPSDANARLNINAGEGRDVELYMAADEGDDNADKWMMVAGSDNIYFKSYSTGSWVTALNIKNDGAIHDSKGNLRSIPHNSGSGTVTLAASDAGKVVSANGSGGAGWVIPASTFAGGDVVTLMNRSGGNLTIDASALTTLYNSADGANVKGSTLTLATRTMATIWFEASSSGYIQASALTVS